MTWATSGGDGFAVARGYPEGGTFFAGYAGGDDTADLIVGPAVVLVVAAGLGVFGAATIVVRRGDRRAVAATGALVVSLISLGYALWDFVLTIVVMSLASAAALALRALARPGVDRLWRGCLGSVDLVVCLGAYVLLPRVGRVG